MDGWIDEKARFTCDFGVGWLVGGKGERVLVVKDGFDRGLGGRGRASELAVVLSAPLRYGVRDLESGRARYVAREVAASSCEGWNASKAGFPVEAKRPLPPFRYVSLSVSGDEDKEISFWTLSCAAP